METTLIKRSTASAALAATSNREIENESPEASTEIKEFKPIARLYEDEKTYEIDVETPAKNYDDFSVEVNSGILTIAAENSFNFSFKINGEVIADDITAAYRNGILKVIVPKVRSFLSSLKLWKKELPGAYFSHNNLI